MEHHRNTDDACRSDYRNTEIRLKTTWAVTFFLHNIGAMGAGQLADKMFNKYLDRLYKVADEFGFSTTAVDSNLDMFYSQNNIHRISYQKSHTIRGAAAALACEGEFCAYYYSSTYPYSALGVFPTKDMGYADPLLLPLLSSSSMKLLSIGSPYSRFEKVELIANNKHAQKNLDVCVGAPKERIAINKPNCSKCWKCSRQLVSLELLDCLELYEEVFDIQYYKKHRARAIAQVLNKRREVRNLSTADKDVILKIKDKWGYVPVMSYILYGAHRLRKSAMDILRFVK